MKIAREIIDEIVARSDIEDVIGRYVTLKRAGSNLKGCCPFHSEKTPSFTVFPDNQSFYCFGCNVGGDVITFIKKAENLEYPEAVSFLAARAGIKIPDEQNEKSGGIPRRRILDMNREAATFFHKCLIDRKLGAPGMAYFRGKRKLSESTINHFGLGYSPDEPGIFYRYMRSKGYTDEELYAGFLCGKSQKTGRPYDYYFGRVMFPIIDTVGNVVAFGGRVTEGDGNGRKYINSSDTPAFKKSKNLFALNFAKNHCTDTLILCEGYMDVIALHAAGFENAVATLGTALTEEQARIMTKYTKSVVLIYDSDGAGQRATQRAMPMLANVGLDVRILKLEGAKDPDEFIKTKGADAFREALAKSATGFNYNLSTILAKYDISQGDQRIRAASEICSVIADCYSNVEREVYIDAASKRLELPPESIRGDVNRIVARRKREFKEKQSREVQTSTLSLGDRVNPDAAKNIRANAAEEAILGLMMLYPEHRKAVGEGLVELKAEDFFTAFGRRVFEAIEELENTGGFEFSLMGENFSTDEMGRLERIRQKRAALSDNGTEVLRDSVRVLHESTAGTDGDAMESIRKKLEALRLKIKDK